MRIAMWSGPRNLSTALMYAFAQRPDFAVRDEPFYAAWLAETGARHPMRDHILAACETDPAAVARSLSTDPGRPHFYAKLMTHHMTPAMPTDWMSGFRHVHLIRHPLRVVASYAARREAPEAADLGFAAQARLFDAHGGLVVDATDLRADPAGVLSRLCAALGLDFDPAMLSWPAGGHPADGPWAPHWYEGVHASTGFAGPEGSLPQVAPKLAELAETGMAVYRRLRARRIR